MIGELQTCWDRDTCYPSLRKKWTHLRPETGQCAVTALVVQDLLGGEIVWNKDRNHYFNRVLPSQVLDLTLKQFDDLHTEEYAQDGFGGYHDYLKIDKTKTRAELLKSESTKNRYELLWSYLLNRLSYPHQ